MKKYIVIIVLLLSAILLTSYCCVAQITAIAEIKNQKINYCTNECIELTIRYENVPYSTITGATYQIHNLSIVSITPWRQIKENTFEETMILQIDSFKDEKAYFYVTEISETIFKFQKLNQVLFVINKDNIIKK